MEPKKNPKADVSRNGSVYFAVGLALMLFVTYNTINYKTYDKSAIDIGMVDMDALDDEEIPITEQLQTPPPPPPPPAAPEVAPWSAARSLAAPRSTVAVVGVIVSLGASTP